MGTSGDKTQLGTSKVICQADLEVLSLHMIRVQAALVISLPC